VSRNRASAKKAGTSFERLVADALALALDDDRIDRRPKNGANDRGDIGGVRTGRGARLVIECKDRGGQLFASEWVREAERERGNDDALAGLVVAKRRGVARPGAQYVIMTLDNLIALLTGERPADADED